MDVALVPWAGDKVRTGHRLDSVSGDLSTLNNSGILFIVMTSFCNEDTEILQETLQPLWYPLTDVLFVVLQIPSYEFIYSRKSSNSNLFPGRTEVININDTCMSVTSVISINIIKEMTGKWCYLCNFTLPTSQNFQD